MLIDPPHYPKFFPNMSNVKWQSNNNLDLDWLSGLYRISNRSLHRIYGEFDSFHLNPSQPLNFSGLDLDHVLRDSYGAISYIFFCGVVALLFLVGGYCWCVCNDCCCCVCVVARKGREKLIGGEDSEKDSEEKTVRKFSGNTIALAVLMGVWLLIFVILIRYTFEINSKTNEVISDIDRDLNKSIKDIDMYLEVTKRQVRYTFQTCFWAMRDKVMRILRLCTGTGCEYVRDQLTVIVQKAIDAATVYIIKHSTELGLALANVQDEIVKAEKQMKSEYEETVVDVNKGLNSFFTAFNIVYCFVFTLVLVGTIIMIFGRGACVRTVGILTLRCAIVLQFVLGVAVIFQLVGLFVTAGVTSEVICPAIRKLERGPNMTQSKRFIQSGKDLLKVNEYKVPEYGDILRACKQDKSAYKAFNLRQAFDIHDITTLTDSYFNIDVSGMLSGVLSHIQRNVNSIPQPVIKNIMNQLSQPNQLKNTGAQIRDRVFDNLNKVNPNEIPDVTQLNLLSAINSNGISPEQLKSQLTNNQNLGNVMSMIRIRHRFPRNNPPSDVSLHPIQVVDEIKEQVREYSNFVVEHVENSLGKCRPAYFAVNSTINLFCSKVIAPVASFWWILQFFPIVFAVIIATAVFIERVD